MEALRCFIEVFGDRAHIARFRQTYKMPLTVLALLKRWKLRVFSWRWEALEYILDDVVLSFNFMVYFDLGAMLGPTKVAKRLYEVSWRAIWCRVKNPPSLFSGGV